MKNTARKADYSVGFTYAVIFCSMLLVFPFRIGGMEILPVCLFFLCIAWMLTDIVQINQGKRKLRRQYRRLDFAVIMLLAYEIGLIAFSMAQKIEENEPEPDYSWKLLLIGLTLLYLLVTEAGTFRTGYLDMILYGGLAVMAVLLLGYLFDPHIGEWVWLWGERTATASYLLVAGTAGALQFCRCEEGLRRVFYVMCTAIVFFLLACNHSVISLWIMAYTLLAIPVLIRPTAALCLSAMQMFFLFVLIISGIGLFSADAGLFLMPVSYEAEHIVCLNMAAAVVGVIFFYCWYRKPEGMSRKKIVMRGFYKLDKLALRGMLAVLVLFTSVGAAWKTLEDDRFDLRAVKGFALPLLEEAEQNHSLLYACLREQGVVGAVLCIVILLLLMERCGKAFGWDKPVKGTLCVAAVSLLPQILVWEAIPNVLPIAVILSASMIGYREKRAGRIGRKSDAGGARETEEKEAVKMTKKGKAEEEIEIEEIKMETVERKSAGKGTMEKRQQTDERSRGKTTGLKTGKGRKRR